MGDSAHNEISHQHFDHVVGPKPFFSAREVAQVLDLSESAVANLIEAGSLISHAFNGGRGRRMTRRVPRHGLVLFLLKTRSYPADTYFDGLLDLLRALSPAELEVVGVRVRTLIECAANRAAPKKQPIRGGG